MIPDLKTTNKVFAVLQLISIIVFVLLCVKLESEKTKFEDKKEFQTYLDHQQATIDSVLNKIKVLESNKVSLYREYNKTNLKYDTIQIVIDSMPSIDGTKLLLSISRELTSKGIE